MSEAAELRSIEVDLKTNTLRLVLDELQPGVAGHTEASEATIDIGASGRLIGVELAERYVDVMPPEPGTEQLIRSAEATITIERAEEGGEPLVLIVPRLGEGYEITWPSGNQ